MAKQEIQNDGIQRGLKDRHISMIAIGGCIGTGLFMTSGGAIHDAGALGALLAYAIIGAMVFFLMTSLGEMATYLPVSGSFSTYATRFVDPSLGFALGWNYWFNWVITVAADVTIAAQVIQYWTPLTGIPAWSWSCLFLIIIFGLNALSVRVYGESEYWFALIKVVTVIIFIIIGLLTILGIMGGEFVGFDIFTKGDGPVLGGNLGGSLLTILGVFLVAGFSFQGTELIGITAGESENPERAVPKAIKQVFWRILLFYILAIFVIGMLIPYDSAALMGGGDDVATSPFTLVFQNAGLAFAASFMNAVILTSVLSAGNSGMYASTRMLYSMSKDKLAFPVFGKTNKSGVPYMSLLVTAVIVIGIFVLQHLSGDAYEYIVAASGMTGFIAWVGIAISHYRFRKAFDKQNYDKSKLKYKAKLFPFGPIFAGFLCVIVIIGQDVDFIKTGAFDLNRFVITYMGIPVFLAFFIYHKLRYKTKIVPLEQVNLRQDVKMDNK
ncbi:amino acid permease [Staphylococcus succinus]|uniref:Amino acid permease n=1 Tax=Staphylococcus succinus TaxID=61015 RepID=A0A9Q6HNU5_9STAP|nr:MULTISPECIES: amino acid permease [Staphylococcus]MBU0437935.1 amino acid permease [Staphylococcus succinus]MDH9160796.1 amino acid permease [Staphylococcus succinus]MEB7461241.1 amino acid permease [Staphylococcus succinus]MEB8124803.1 amino acid permease [Staphylococcus succinus]MEB8126796.1 amino acid permease [Staphylococcus succinus]